MNESNEPCQNLSIEDAAISGQVGQAGRNLTQVKGEQTVVIDGNGNVVEYHNITQNAGEEITRRELIMTSPYKGLKKFEPEDAARFFGRDAVLDDLEDELDQTNLILLLGASGSGKSSVVRAGVVPRLRQTCGNEFVSLIFTPDRNPFESFYGSLLSRGYSQAEAQLARDVSVETLSRVVEKVRPPEAFWLIVIDQFEELFTTSDAGQRDTFIRGLVKLCEERGADARLKIVATMRADFLDQLDPSPANALASLTQKHRPLITQMQPEALRQAIEKPAAQHGVVFEAGLVAEIAQAVQGRAGYLPLLQYTLDLLWESEVADGGINDRTLNIDSYHRLGKVEGALQQRVTEIYRALSPDEQRAAKRVFLRLVDIGGDAAAETDWKPVRQRAARSEFDDEIEKKVLDQLIQARLLVSDVPMVANGPGQTMTAGPKTADGLEATVDIAHEILLTSWDLLKEWIEQNREAIALRNRLKSDVRQWRAHKPDDELWSGVKLAKATALQSDPTFNRVLGGFGSEATAFVEASVGLRDRQEKEKEDQKQRELTALRRIAKEEIKARTAAQNTIKVMVVATIATLGLTIFSMYQWNQAVVGQIKALSESSNAKFLSNRNSFDSLVDALKAAERLKRLAWLPIDKAVSSDILTYLNQSLNWVKEHNRLEGHTNFIQSVSYSPNGELIATASYDKTVKLWNKDGSSVGDLGEARKSNVLSVTFSSDSKKIATAREDGTLEIWNRDSTLIQEWKAHNAKIYSIDFSPSGEIIATADESGNVKLWKFNNVSDDYEFLKEIHAHTGKIMSVQFRPPNGQILATGGDGGVKLWDWENSRLIHHLSGHDGNVSGISFSRNGLILASASFDKKIILYDLEGSLNQEGKNPVSVKERKQFYATHAAPLLSIDLNIENQLIASGSRDATIELRDLEGNFIEKLEGHNGRVNSINFSPDGMSLVSGSNDKTAKLWTTKTLATIAKGHVDDAYSVNFNFEGTRFASASRDETVRVWDQSGDLVSEPIIVDYPVNDVSFSPDDSAVAIASKDKHLKLWDFDAKSFKDIPGHTGEITSVSYSVDGKSIVSSGADGMVILWSADGHLTESFSAHGGRVYSARFNRNGEEIVTSGEDNAARVWNRRGQKLMEMNTHKSAIYEAAFSPDSKMIATVSEDETAKLWDRTTGEEINKLEGHTAGIWGVDFSSDGHFLATASDDKTVKVWTKEGALVTTLIGHTEAVNAVRFSKDGTTLITASNDDDIILWKLENLKLNHAIASGCKWTRKLNDYEKWRTLCHEK